MDKLLHRLADEFKILGLPFKIREVSRTPHMSFSSCEPQYITTIEINTECSDEEYPYLRTFAYRTEIIQMPMINFQDLKITDYFESEQDAFNFSMGLDIQHRNIHRLVLKMYLDESNVDSFIEEFRHKTEPLRIKAYEKQFDKEVDDHLSEDEYNPDNGHQ